MCGTAPRNCLQQCQRRFSIFFRVKRERGRVTRCLVAIAVVGFFFLEAGGVGKQYAQEFGGAARAINRPAETLLDEARKIAGVIDVRVREQHRIDRGRRKRRRFPIPLTQRPRALEETAINQHALLIVVALALLAPLDARTAAAGAQAPLP